MLWPLSHQYPSPRYTAIFPSPLSIPMQGFNPKGGQLLYPLRCHMTRWLPPADCCIEWWNGCATERAPLGLCQYLTEQSQQSRFLALSKRPISLINKEWEHRILQIRDRPFDPQCLRWTQYQNKLISSARTLSICLHSLQKVHKCPYYMCLHHPPPSV